jgi:tRNA(His) 5'-end guanylyltransferase
MDKTTLGDRMKNNYENISRYYLTRRMPVIARLDGRAFHTFTRGFKKPFDDILVKTMQETMKHLCENIQGCVLGYTQSDEISLVLVDYAELTTDAWFGNNLQKMCSVSASMATMAFNKFFYNNMPADEENSGTYYKALEKGAMFDSRVFTIPKEEVCNYMLWRQQDATRNSIQSVGQANFSQKELYGKSCNNIQDMLMTQKGINWNDYATTLKRGSCCIKEITTVKRVDILGKEVDIQTRSEWVIDNEIPIFSQDRNYIERLIDVGG